MTAPVVPASPLSPHAEERIAELLRRELAAHEALAADQRQAIAETDLVDRANAEELLRRAEEAMADIRHALRRISQGNYGSCEACGRSIPFERLEVIPHARSCVGCQRAATALR